MNEEKNNNSVFKNILAIIGILFLALVLSLAGDIIGAITSGTLAEVTGLGEKYGLFFDYFSTFGAILVLIIFMLIYKKDKPLLKKLKFKPGHFLIGLVIGGTLNFICAFAAMLNKDLVIVPNKVAIIGLVIAFVLVCMQSTGEELLCRLFVHEKVKRHSTALVAMIVNSLFFAALHLGNDGITWVSFIDLLVYGLSMTLYVHYLDGFWIASAVHTSWNFMQNFILGLPNSGIPAEYSLFKITAAKDSFFYNTVFGVEGTMFCVILEIVAFIAIFLILRKNKSA